MVTQSASPPSLDAVGMPTAGSTSPVVGNRDRRDRSPAAPALRVKRADPVQDVPDADARASAEAIHLPSLASVLIPLAVIAGLVHHFDIETAAFFRLLAATIAGFVIHYFLPLRLRLPFFVGLTVVT